MTYTETFYDTIRAGCQTSAAVIVPLLLDRYTPSSVLDIGCGEGWFCAQWANAGVTKVVGVDGDYVTTPAPGDWQFHAADLEHLDALDNVPDGFDLVTCLEVAEHLEAERAASFVAALCERAPIVAFSAAIPGQGGAGHVNEQWPAYWADLFADHGYGVDRDDVRLELWGDDRVECWYQQNLLVFVADAPSTAGGNVPPALVHPTIYDARRAR